MSKISLDDQIKYCKDMLQLWNYGLDRMWHPNGERRIKDTLDAEGKRHKKTETNEQWQYRLEECRRIREDTIPYAEEVLKTLLDIKKEIDSKLGSNSNEEKN